MRSIEAVSQYDKFMDVLLGFLPECQTLITPMKQYVKLHIKEIEEEYRLVLGLQQELLRTTSQPQWATPEIKKRIVTRPKLTPSETD